MGGHIDFQLWFIFRGIVALAREVLFWINVPHCDFRPPVHSLCGSVSRSEEVLNCFVLFGENNFVTLGGGGKEGGEKKGTEKRWVKRGIGGKSLELIRLILNSRSESVWKRIYSKFRRGGEDENRCSSNIKLDRELSQLVPFNTEFQIKPNTRVHVSLLKFLFGHRAKITSTRRIIQISPPPPQIISHTIFTIFPSRLQEHTSTMISL